MTLAYAVALADVRGCLAALADTATSFADSVRYEQLLLHLDAINDGDGPALTPTSGAPCELLRQLESAIEGLIDLGGDGLTLELLLADAGVW